jgi:DNA polymerase IV
LRRASSIERLYLDFDGFFASVMQQAMPELRGKPVGVIPFETREVHRTCVIACSKEAKRCGVSNVMPVPEARAKCPGIILVTQRPDLFQRAHNALLNEIRCEIPIDAVKSIDELTCRLDQGDIAKPEELAARIKRRLRRNLGEHITCSIGFAANRFLAKIACKMDKPNGVTIWRPEDMPGPILPLPFDDIPGIGSRMEKRWNKAGVWTMGDLWAVAPKQMRQLWGNVNGERLWYALHGYDIQATPTGRGMYGHGRVSHPIWRSIEKARDTSRLLLTKAERRMRRDHFYANSLSLWLQESGAGWSASRNLPCVSDDHAVLSALEALWDKARKELSPRAYIIRVGVTLMDLSPADARQLDIFLSDD